jgi:hypothetical protein
MLVRKEGDSTSPGVTQARLLARGCQPQQNISQNSGGNMDEKDLISVVEKLPLEKIYVDLLQPGFKQVGKALETVLGLGNTCLLPIQMFNKKTEALFITHIQKYQKKMASIHEDKVVPAIPELAVPIIDHFTYVSDEVLSDLYENLLVSASSMDTVGFAHPGFIRVIEQLSPDEAKLLLYFRDTDFALWAYWDVTTMADGERVRFGVPYRVLAPESLTFPDNMEVYLANLQGLGLLQRIDQNELNRSLQRRIFLQNLQTEINDAFERAGGNSTFSSGKYVSDGAALTAYGSMFLKACTSK